MTNGINAQSKAVVYVKRKSLFFKQHKKETCIQEDMLHSNWDCDRRRQVEDLRNSTVREELNIYALSNRVVHMIIGSTRTILKTLGFVTD